MSNGYATAEAGRPISVAPRVTRDALAGCGEAAPARAQAQQDDERIIRQVDIAPQRLGCFLPVRALGLGAHESGHLFFDVALRRGSRPSQSRLPRHPVFCDHASHRACRRRRSSRSPPPVSGCSTPAASGCSRDALASATSTRRSPRASWHSTSWHPARMRAPRSCAPDRMSAIRKAWPTRPTSTSAGSASSSWLRRSSIRGGTSA